MRLELESTSRLHKELIHAKEMEITQKTIIVSTYEEYINQANTKIDVFLKIINRLRIEI